MRSADLRPIALMVALTGASAAFAAPPADAPVSRLGASPRSARLLAEGVTVAVGGVVLPMAGYLGLTAGLRSFVGFFAGIATATIVGVVLAPIALIIVGHLMGAPGGAGRATLGALAGLVLGLLIGLPLATVPGAGYLVGLGLTWVLPSVGAMIGFEWGRGPSTEGLVVARF